MKKINLLLATIAIFSIVICKSSLAACPSGQIEDSSTGHCIKTGSDCDGKCTWYYDTETQDLVIKPNEGASGDLIVKNTYGYSYGSAYIQANVKNVTIEEGITGLEAPALNTWTNPLGSNSTLKLPNSLTSITTSGQIDLAFRTVELSTENLENISGMSLRRIENLILTPSDGKALPSSFFGRRYNDEVNYGINIICNGDINLCTQMVASARNTEEKKGITFQFEERDENGNTIANYDSNGTLLKSYNYINDGSVEIYNANGNLIGLEHASHITPKQAAALVKDKGNTVSITW